MWRWHKLVSVGVLAIIAVTPFVSLWGLCTSQPADAMQCPPDCPMMAEMKAHDSGMKIKADEPGTCCTVKSSKAVPATTATLVPQLVSVEPTTVSAPLLAACAAQDTILIDSSPPSVFDSQAQLCTFLI